MTDDYMPNGPKGRFDWKRLLESEKNPRTDRNESMTVKKDDGSIDVYNRYGFAEYTAKESDSGISADMARRLNNYEEFFDNRLTVALTMYFDRYEYMCYDKHMGYVPIGQDDIEDISDFIKNFL